MFNADKNWQFLFRIVRPHATPSICFVSDFSIEALYWCLIVCFCMWKNIKSFVGTMDLIIQAGFNERTRQELYENYGTTDFLLEGLRTRVEKEFKLRRMRNEMKRGVVGAVETL